ncbi:hypothetical protein CRG98_005319 [Punica granatum]|uniref:Uncharacterized protein n=1 Tax=Punica granatum TaxID=22663 RepID=A0A2I0L0P5_PUNGR|nr:hypothetical protein CRG98_005319 [Punica granatum]
MGACPVSCLMHGCLPGGLQYARAHCPVDCEVHGRLPGRFAICTGRIPNELHGSKVLTQWTCGVHERLLGWFAICTRRILNELHGSKAPTQWTCGVHERLLGGFARCTAFLIRYRIVGHLPRQSIRKGSKTSSWGSVNSCIALRLWSSALVNDDKEDNALGDYAGGICCKKYGVVPWENPFLFRPRPMECCMHVTFVSGNLVITTLEWLDRDWGHINMFSLITSRHA